MDDHDETNNATIDENNVSETGGGPLEAALKPFEDSSGKLAISF